MFLSIAAIVVIGFIQSPSTQKIQGECYDYDLFSDVVEKGGAKLTQTIELPSFSTVKRLLIVTLDGTKETYLGLADCVVVPPAFVDYPDDMKPIPVLPLLPPKKPTYPPV
jgi:hypothetical protein